MATPNMIALCILILTAVQPCATDNQHVFQPHLSKSVRLGDPVTLECYTDVEDVISWVWFKHTMEHGLKSIITIDFANQRFHGEFANDSRMAVQKSAQHCNLSLSQVSVTDVASYHCAIHRFGTWYFGAGTFLVLRDSLKVIQQPVSAPVDPGASVTLQCILDRESCAGEHSVYWFRHGSGESLPGLLYTHGNRSDECEKISKAGSPTRSCVYSLPKRNLSRSDAGTYYCAVATCRHILFGNGTKLDIEDGHNSMLIYLSLVAVIILSLIVNIILIFMLRKARRVQKGTYQAADASATGEDDQTDSMNYAALSFASHKPQSRRTQKVDDGVLYSAVRQQLGL